MDLDEQLAADAACALEKAKEELAGEGGAGTDVQEAKLGGEGAVEATRGGIR